MYGDCVDGLYMTYLCISDFNEQSYYKRKLCSIVIYKGKQIICSKYLEVGCVAGVGENDLPWQTCGVTWRYNSKVKDNGDDA